MHVCVCVCVCVCVYLCVRARETDRQPCSDHVSSVELPLPTFRKDASSVNRLWNKLMGKSNSISSALLQESKQGGVSCGFYWVYMQIRNSRVRVCVCVTATEAVKPYDLRLLVLPVTRNLSIVTTTREDLQGETDTATTSRTPSTCNARDTGGELRRRCSRCADKETTKVDRHQSSVVDRGKRGRQWTCAQRTGM